MSRYIILSSPYIAWEGLNNIPPPERDFICNDALTRYTQTPKQPYTAWEGPNNIPLAGQTVFNLYPQKNPRIETKLYNSKEP